MGGLSQIGLPYYQGAYPIAGATFVNPPSPRTRIPPELAPPALTNWLCWYFGGSEP